MKKTKLCKLCNKKIVNRMPNARYHKDCQKESSRETIRKYQIQYKKKYPHRIKKANDKYHAKIKARREEEKK